MYLFNIMRGTFQKYPEVWNDNIHRTMTLNTMSMIGTNMLLKDDQTSRVWAIFISQVIMSLENYIGTGDVDSVIHCRTVATKRRDLDLDYSSRRRDILKFYRKRVSCKCLKKMHLEARKNTKLGLCWYCKKEYERSYLSVCSRCMLTQYCSRHTAKNKLVIGVVKPILQKLRPTYGRTNQPKITENAITTLWPSSLYDHRYGHNTYSKRIIVHMTIPMARLLHQNMKIQPFFMISA